MPKREQSIEINAPADKVFAYVADLTRHPEWASFPLEMKKTSQGDAGVGATYTSTGKQFGTHTDSITVTEFTPGSKIAFESRGDAGQVRHTFTVSDQAGATRLAKGFDMVKPSLSSRIATLFIVLNLPGALRKDLRRIKAKVEGAA